MPIYPWRCVNCNKEVELVKKTFDEYKDPPEEQSDENCDSHKWEKLMSTFKLARGPNFKGKKGYW